MEGQRICFHYDEEYAYNPVTGEYSQWNCRSVAEDDEHVIDTAPGDVFDLATGRVPFRLPAHPRFDSIADVKAPR
ncbi:hypothetical protein [Sorangium sp. So ce385]|uniref:hypothetical protein n=1 Tax=Sorangium sp. So ce385 TaxID=3133308 RepID=UPI003F5BC393